MKTCKNCKHFIKHYYFDENIKTLELSHAGLCNRKKYDTMGKYIFNYCENWASHQPQAFEGEYKAKDGDD